MRQWIMNKHLAVIGFTLFLPLFDSAFNLSMYEYHMLQTLVQTVNDPWSTAMGNKVMFFKLRFFSFAMSIYHSSTSILLQFLGNSSQGNSQSLGIEWDVASQAILSSASVRQNTLPSLLDMMISMDPLAFLLLGIQIIWSGVSMLYSSFFHVFWQQPCSNSFG